jgi:hypothetical protein
MEIKKILRLLKNCTTKHISLFLVHKTSVHGNDEKKCRSVMQIHAPK